MWHSYQRRYYWWPRRAYKKGETLEEAAIRETEEEFGIKPKDLICVEQKLDIKAKAIFICTEYEGQPHSVDGEMLNPHFCSLDELEAVNNWLFEPFALSLELLKKYS